MSECRICDNEIMDPSAEPLVCQSCFEKQKTARFEIMMNGLSADEMTRSVKCARCGEVFEYDAHWTGHVRYCRDCVDAYGYNFRDEEWHERYANSDTPLNRRLEGEWRVEYDPIPVAEGGLRKGAVIANIDVVRGLKSQFAYGTVLRHVSGKVIRY